MIIVQISDTHLTLGTPDVDRRICDFALTIADINALEPPPDAIVHTGDIVHNGRRDEYAQAAALLAKAQAPVYVLPGNKDDRANLRAAFSKQTYLASTSEFIDYAIEDHPVRLIALDTLKPGRNRGDFSPEQARRLLQWIDAEPDKPIAVFTHHPPFEVTVGPDRFHFETMKSMALLRDALQGGSLPRSAAMFTAPLPDGSEPSPRAWCRASRQTCARANIRRRCRRARSITCTGSIRFGVLSLRAGWSECKDREPPRKITLRFRPRP